MLFARTSIIRRVCLHWNQQRRDKSFLYLLSTLAAQPHRHDKQRSTTCKRTIKQAEQKHARKHAGWNAFHSDALHQSGARRGIWKSTLLFSLRFLHHGILPIYCCFLVVLLIVLGFRCTQCMNRSKDTTGSDVVMGFIVIITACALIPVCFRRHVVAQASIQRTERQNGHQNTSWMSKVGAPAAILGKEHRRTNYYSYSEIPLHETHQDH